MSEDFEQTAELLIDMSGWYTETALLEWVVEIDLLGHLKAGPKQASDLASELDLDPVSLNAVLDGLVGMRVLNLVGESYQMAAGVGPLLEPEGGEGMTDFIRHHARYWRLWAELTDMLRHSGEPRPWMQDVSVHNDPDAHDMLIRSCAAETTPQERLRLLQATSVEQGRTIVDLGGGHGLLGMLASERWGLLSETWDVPNSRPAWETYAKRLPADVRARVLFRAADIVTSEPWATPRPDVTHCMICHVIANFERQVVVQLLRNVFHAFPNAEVCIFTPWRKYGDARDPISTIVFDVLIQSASKAGRVHLNDEVRDYAYLAGGRVLGLREVDGSAVWACRSGN